jgi:hypothetical protein
LARRFAPRPDGRRVRGGFDGVVSSDEEAACLLPVVISELVTGWSGWLAALRFEAQINGWLDERAARLTG